jgi:hypothetical protein
LSIRGFIDPLRSSRFRPPRSSRYCRVLAVTAVGARSFDALRCRVRRPPICPDGVEWPSFETLLDAFDLSCDMGLVRLAKIATLLTSPPMPGPIRSGGRASRDRSPPCNRRCVRLP